MIGTDWSALLWFALVVAAIPVALWFVKRTPIGHGAAAGAPRLVAVLPLSASQKVVTLEVGRGEHRMWMVLGVTPQSITSLTSLAPQEEAPPPTPADTFAPLLKRLRQGGKGDDAL